MVGVKLCSSWSKSRRVNGDIVQQKVNGLMRSWRSGKFMPLSLRPYSANVFALSKVWFKCATVNLREGDFSSINSSLKRWIYADLLLKPEEIILFRPVHCGGLGLASVKHKSLAFLIKTFLEMASNPNFIVSQYLSILFRSQIQGEEISCPPLPPYYTETFFVTIRKAKQSGYNVVTMTTRQWYRYLLNEDILKTIQEDGSITNRLCRSERLYSEVEWDTTWVRSRLSLFSSTTTSFLFKLLHDILPTEERLNQTIRNNEAICRFNCPSNSISNSEHCFFFCSKSRVVGSWLLQLCQTFGPATESCILKLNVADNIPLIWITGNTLQFIWSKRSAGKKADLKTCLAYLHTELLLLKDLQNEELGNEIISFLNQNSSEQWAMRLT